MAAGLKPPEATQQVAVGADTAAQAPTLNPGEQQVVAGMCDAGQTGGKLGKAPDIIIKWFAQGGLTDLQHQQTQGREPIRYRTLDMAKLRETVTRQKAENNPKEVRELAYDFEIALIQMEMTEIHGSLNQVIAQIAEITKNNGTPTHELSARKAGIEARLSQLTAEHDAVNKDRETQLGKDERSQKPLEIFATQLGATAEAAKNNPLGETFQIFWHNRHQPQVLLTAFNARLQASGIDINTSEHQATEQGFISLCNQLNGEEEKQKGNPILSISQGFLSLLLMFLMKKMLEGGQRQQ